MEDDADRAQLLALNQGYVQAFLDGDVAWYGRHLAEEFVCIESDGSRKDKAAFLAAAGRGPDVAGYELVDVEVRFYGETALVQARGRWTRRDGTRGFSRYTDVWVRRDGGWRTVAAQVTRSET